MTNDEEPREKDVGLERARQRDIARRGLTGFHKRKRTDESQTIVDETTAELGPFEYDKKGLAVTAKGSLYTVPTLEPFVKVLQVPDNTVSGIGTNLPMLAPPRNWLEYILPNFVESGRITKAVLKGSYTGPLPFGSSRLLLSRRSQASPLWLPEDILYDSDDFSIPEWGGGLPSNAFSDLEDWISEIINADLVYEFPRITGQNVPAGPIQDLDIIGNLFIYVADWRVIPTDYARLLLYIEDRGRY